MLLIQYFFVWSFFCVSIALSSSDLNLHLTDPIADNEHHLGLQSHCLHFPAPILEAVDAYEMIIFCLAQSPSTWLIQKNHLDQKYSFNELRENNITSEQLLHWSAPFDLAERYQFYLDELSTQNNSSVVKQEFYNCSSPRFGPECQYSLDHPLTSLHAMVADFYLQAYQPPGLTCYEQLQCDRGSHYVCLDWSEICDGYVDCLNNGVDEQECWQLNINPCEEDEYECNNGQCISKTFVRDGIYAYECLDRSDESDASQLILIFPSELPRISKEDSACPNRFANKGGKLTSSCVMMHYSIFRNTVFKDDPRGVTSQCWIALKCILGIIEVFASDSSVTCSQSNKQDTIKSCPEMIVAPAKPLLFGHIYLAYYRDAVINDHLPQIFHYICYDDQRCGVFPPNSKSLMINNHTCRRITDFNTSSYYRGPTWGFDYHLHIIYEHFSHCNKIPIDKANVCNNPRAYQCKNSSKCISVHRLCDRVNDCDYKDDEDCPSINNTCPKSTFDIFFKCSRVIHKCISIKLVQDGICDCSYDEYNMCEDEPIYQDFYRRQISFQTMCDGFIELVPVKINNQNENDETHCDHWPCDNIYTHCDGYWNCYDGADEMNCSQSSLSQCSFGYHPCVSPHSLELTCLSMEKANDGHIDCLGATDEVKQCRSKTHVPTTDNFYCGNDTAKSCGYLMSLCFMQEKCVSDHIEWYCPRDTQTSSVRSICSDSYQSIRSKAQTFLCRRFFDSQKPKSVHFSLGISASQEAERQTSTTPLSFLSVGVAEFIIDQRCHRGLPLRIWIDVNQNLTMPICLCSLSFYGDKCQYQQQRVTITLKFQVYSDSRRTLFAILIYLIDHTDEQLIHSHQQLTYIYGQHCRRKFNFYLLYSQRPKDLFRNYSIRVDFYEKSSSLYRGSYLLPILYPFLPVYRLATQLDIPRTNQIIASCKDLRCHHGRCIRYLNHQQEALPHSSFCQCHPGWSGKFCSHPIRCQCSSDSLCLGQTAVNNRSICLCPVNRWGSRCLLHNHQCTSNNGHYPCLNGGQCVTMEDSVISDKTYICLCPKRFSGDRCETIDTQLTITFDSHIRLPPSVLIHFIEVIKDASPVNGSTFKSFAMKSQSIVVQWSRPFHLVLAEFINQSYYLVLVQQEYQPSSNISRFISSSDRCPHLTEIFNETFLQLPLLIRMKYYHLPCQNRLKMLSCFYDTAHFCLCQVHNGQHQANCFEFNSMLRHDCFGQSNCENGAQCLQDRSVCPQTSICVCRSCYFGTRCQFSSNLFGLSLDAILGYSIQPHRTLTDQFLIVKLSVGLVTIMTLTGIINGVLSLITFKRKPTRTVGSGIYLLGASICTLLIVILFALKFWILLITHINGIKNQSFLSIQCISIDFLLRLGLNIDQWLNALVAVERSVATFQGSRFNKTQSQVNAKYVMIFVTLVIIATTIHDPLNRRLLIDDQDDEQRIWCIVSYKSSAIQIFDFTMNIIHVVVPFLLNLCSALIIVIWTARQRANFQKGKTHRQVFYQQLQHHKHILISPLILIFLVLPRLIISLISQCIKATDEAWLLLIGYFICFLPPMLTFVVFVLPSKLYREEFEKSIRNYQELILSRISNHRS